MCAPAMERVRHMSATLCDTLARFPAKALARAAQVHEKTAARWRTGDAIPAGDAVLRLMAGDDAIFAALLEAAGRAPDAKRARAMAHLQQALREITE
jgi:hypothetical protein